MDFFDVINKRRSVRKYTDEDVPNSVIKKALDAALLAPNSSNMQPWEFYHVKSPLKKAKLVEACLSQPSAATAKELIVAVARMDTWRRNAKIMREVIKSNSHLPAQVDLYYSKIIPLAYTNGIFSIIGFIKTMMAFIIGFFKAIPRGPNSQSELRETFVKTTALACQNFMNAITAEGFGSCAMEGMDEVRVKKILGLPRRSRVVMVISVGKPDEKGIWGDRIRFNKDLFLFEV